ncbi:hypothetical protein HY839_00675 [Candidatus Azambacteria bacterium]|nr:hypothetical protein [Candidatus Azambacteria bacterium]
MPKEHYEPSAEETVKAQEMADAIQNERADETMWGDQKEQSEEREVTFEAGREYGPYPDIDVILDPRLETEYNNPERDPGIEAAANFAHTLMDSVKNSKIYKGDQRVASGNDKFLYSGWAEHEAVERAFESAFKVENHVDLYMVSPEGKKYYKSKIFFFDKNGENTHMIDGTFNQDGGLEYIGGVREL